RVDSNERFMSGPPNEVDLKASPQRRGNRHLMQTTINIMDSLEFRIKQRATELGFALVGIAPAMAADGFVYLQAWLEQGYAGRMAYMEQHAEARRHPSSILAEVQSVVMLAMPHHVENGAAETPRLTGKVARYARSKDYHEVLRQRLNELLDWVQTAIPDCKG